MQFPDVEAIVDELVPILLGGAQVAVIVGAVNAILTPLAAPVMAWALGGEGALR